ncbi:MAG: beta-propeller fold lactonase family protein [Acidobacteriaceae bacterium]
MDLSPKQFQPLSRVARRRIISICVAAIFLGIVGCQGFFVPECQEYNDCTSTTTSTTSTTGTTSTTATTGTTSTTSTTATTGTTTSTTSTTSTTGTTTSTTSTTGSPTTASASTSPFLYVSNANTGTIGTFAVAAGKVSNVAQSTVKAPASPTAIAGTPTGKFLYLATNDGAVYLNTIASNGNLQAGNSGNPVAHVTQPTWMSMDRSGKWLFVASSAAGGVQEFQIDAKTGALHPVSQSPALDPGKPTEVYFTPDNQKLFVALGKGGVDAFPFDAGSGTVGTRQHIAPLHTSSADNVLTSDGASRNLYVSEANTGIRAFSIGGGASLQEISGSPFGSPQSAPTSMAMEASSGDLVTANSAANAITQYSVAADGALTVVSRSPSSTDSSPAALIPDANGRGVVSISRNAVPNPAQLPSQ